MSDGSSSNARQQRMEIRMYEDELELLDGIAERHGMTRSAYVRTAVLHGARPTLLSVDWARVNDYAKFNAELSELAAAATHLRNDINRVGTNINQIARQVNASAKANGNPKLERAMFTSLSVSKDELKKISDAVNHFTAAVDDMRSAVLSAQDEDGDE